MKASLRKIVESMRRNPVDVRFTDLEKVCDGVFGPARRRGGSHAIYRTPWRGDPRVNIQDDAGRAKAYQVKQVLAAIDEMESR